MLIAIAGKAGAGKDTAAQHLLVNHDMFSVPFALSFKRAFKAMFGWELHQWDDRGWKERVQPSIGFSPRQAAQTIGTEWRDMLDPSKLLWCKLLEKYCETVRWPLDQVVIPDCRFEHEQDWVHSKGGVVWYIDRHATTEVLPHISENSLNHAKVDTVFHNDGSILDLYHKIREHMKEKGYK